MDFEFATASRIIFGADKRLELGPLVRSYGEKVFLITGANAERASWATELFNREAVPFTTFQIVGEPTTDIARQAICMAIEANANVIVSIGGGSVIDTGKVVAAMLTNEGRLFDYLEVIGEGQPLKNPSAPFVAIPTTAGTGAEVTRNAVLGSTEHKVKVSMRSPYMLPAVALIDPVLTESMPRAITASTGLDALTQLMEAFVSNKANPMTDSLCREGLQRAGRSIKSAYKGDSFAREDMALAGLFSGLALANAKLGAVHGFAGPIGGMYPAPHGVICARFLPHIMKLNIKALEARNPDSPVLGRYKEISHILTGSDETATGIKWIQDLCKQLDGTPLKEYGIHTRAFPEIVEKAKNASSMKGNPIVLTDEELTEALSLAVNV
jgi:alcohol dehydrogenase class IV